MVTESVSLVSDKNFVNFIWSRRNPILSKLAWWFQGEINRVIVEHDWWTDSTHYLLLAESLGTSPQLSQGKKRRRSESETETQSSTEARNDANNDDNEDDDTPGMTSALFFIEDHQRLSIILQWSCFSPVHVFALS